MKGGFWWGRPPGRSKGEFANRDAAGDRPPVGSPKPRSPFWIHHRHGFFMKRNLSGYPLFALIGFCLLAVSLLTGCAWSAEGDGLRIQVPADSSDEAFPP